MSKIILLQPGYAHYRDDLFRIMSNRHDLLIVYQDRENVYPGDEGPKGDNYKFLGQTALFKWIGYLLLLLKHKPDIIITSRSMSSGSLVSYFFARIFRKKLVLWILEWKVPEYNLRNIIGKLKPLRWLIAKRIILNCDALVVGGSASLEYATKLGKNKSDIFIASQCAKDLSTSEMTRTKGSDRRIKFLYLSRIVKWKGLNYLLEAFARLEKEIENVELLVAGDGPYKNECIRLTDELNINNIEYLGRIKSENVGKLYREVDVFVLPSIYSKNSYESWGLVINEAMGMRLPVITTDAVGASFDLVSNDNGIVVKNRDSYELYKAMKKMCGSDLVQMGENSRRIFADKNNYKTMADEFSRAIHHVSANVKFAD